MSYPSRGPSVQVVDRAGAPWPAHRLPRPRASGPLDRRGDPLAAMQTWRRPGTVHKSSYRLRFPTPQIPSQPKLPVDSPHSPHPPPPHRAHTPPKPSHLSRPVEDCEGSPGLVGVRNLGLDDPSPGRPDSPCNFGDRIRRSLTNHAEYGTSARITVCVVEQTSDSQYSLAIIRSGKPIR